MIDILLLLMAVHSACYHSDVMSMLKSHPLNSLGKRLKTGFTVVGPGAAAIVAGQRGEGHVIVTFQVTPCFALAHAGKASYFIKLTLCN